MTILDFNKEKQEINKIFDICIIGTGIANYPIIKELINEKFNVCVIESGSFKKKEVKNKFISNFIRNNFHHEYEMFGGNSSVWANRLMLPDKIDRKNINWPCEIFTNENIKKALKYFNINNEKIFLTDKVISNRIIENIAIWPKKILRINRDKKFINNIIDKFNLIINAKVSHFMIDENSFNKVIIKNAFSTQEIKSRIFILGCGGIENARILLQTKIENKKIKNFDKYNQIGKYISDHPKKIVFKIKTSNYKFIKNYLPQYKKNYKCQHGISLRNEEILKHNLLRMNYNINYCLKEESELKFNKIIQKSKKNKINLLKHFNFLIKNIFYKIPKENFIYYYYYYYQKFFENKNYNNINLHVDLFAEQKQSSSNHISVDINKLDDHGIPLPIININFDEDLIKSEKISNKIIKEYLEKNGVEVIEQDNDYIDGSHFMSSTRMSNKEQEGVVNKNNNVFNYDNIFITGNSTFPNIGYFNPTLVTLLISQKVYTSIKKSIHQ